MRRQILYFLGVCWASPYTLFGASIGIVGICTGGRVKWRTCAVEFHGGVVSPFLYYICGPWVSAITFGHSILGRDQRALDDCRIHEWVHVRQYQRWGPFFGPAYLSCSLYQWWVGKRAYRDNPFEVEAYDYCDHLATESTKCGPEGERKRASVELYGNHPF